jgi:hypothetical protein
VVPNYVCGRPPTNKGQGGFQAARRFSPYGFSLLISYDSFAKKVGPHQVEALAKRMMSSIGTAGGIAGDR